MSKIVVIDDSQAELQLIESYLKAAHHTVVTCSTTDHLEEKIAAERPDLIVMDVVMPGRNGFQACRDLKNDSRFTRIPVLLCTSKGQESDKFWGQQQGANGHVVKPFKAEDLLQAVRLALR
ncbi:MAG: two-component system response regulator [Nitrospira sp. WS238]|nr:two-component system response regulator [Nitrospira sp. WS238]